MSKYSKEFKEEALKLSDEIGAKKAALQLSITQRQRKSIHKRCISKIIKRLRNNTELKRHGTLL